MGPVTLHSYGLLVALGILFASWYLTKNAFRISMSSDQIIDLILVTTVSGFILARIFYVIYDWNYFKEHPIDIVAIWKGGIVFYGGLLGGVFGFLIYTKRTGQPVLKTLDLFTPAAALAQGFGRIGCFLNGCCYGRPTAGPLGVLFPFSGVPLHPTQLYDAVFCFLLFAFLAVFYSKNSKHAGRTSFLYFTLHPVGRFVIEFFRNDMPRMPFGFTLGQWMGIGIFTSAAACFLILKLKRHD